MLKPIDTYQLSNGLQIKLKEIHTAPIISHWVWYRVGSRDEIPGKTGISHWVEHLQFKGTTKYPMEELDKSISRTGGIWNALTYLDWTTYFETMPADQIDLALDLEADRMLNSTFDPEEVASERTVVISERQGRENHPGFLLKEAVRGAAFRVHPYHHEIIGDLADLQSMARDDLYQHYRTYYRPNNALIAVAGDFDRDDMLERLKELYGGHPAGDAVPRINRPEPPQKGEHRLIVEGPGETRLVNVAYHTPPAAHPDFFPLLILDSLLTGPQGLNLFGGGGVSNKTSRLYSRWWSKKTPPSAFTAAFPPPSTPSCTASISSSTREPAPRKDGKSWTGRSSGCRTTPPMPTNYSGRPNKPGPYSLTAEKASPTRLSGWDLRRCSPATTG